MRTQLAGEKAMTTSRICPFQNTLELLGRKHVLDILRLLAERNPQRFTELQAALRVNPKSLSARLRDLRAEGILDREAFREIPPRVQYRLTGKGRDLVRIFDHLAAWHGRHPS